MSDKSRRYEEAIASYDQALNIKPDKHEAWDNRGVALGNLGRYEEAIALVGLNGGISAIVNKTVGSSSTREAMKIGASQANTLE